MDNLDVLTTLRINISRSFYFETCVLKDLWSNNSTTHQVHDTASIHNILLRFFNVKETSCSVWEEWNKIA